MRRASIVTGGLRGALSLAVLTGSVLLGGCSSAWSEVRAERAEVAGRPSVGAFFNDGGDGDVRARTEHFFGSGRADLDDITNGLQNNAARGLDDDPAADFSRAFGYTAFGASTFEDPSDAATRRAEGAPSGEPRVSERHMVYTGELVLDAVGPEQVLETLVGRAEKAGGYLASRRDMFVVLRIPAKDFTAFVDATKTLGRVLRESVNAQDVTEDYTDLEIRLKNAQASRERLIALLEKATEMKDVLAIEKELSRVTEEIERFEGKLRVMKDRIAFATLSVSLVASDGGPVDDVEPPRRPSRFDWVRAVGAEEVWRGF